MKSSILYIRLAFPNPPKQSDLPGKSWLLRGFTLYKDLEIYGFADPTIKKDSSLGKIFSGVEPNGKNEFGLELGEILPDLLPNVNNQIEYCLNVLDKNNKLREICISNQMSRIRYKYNNDNYQALIPRSWLDSLPTNISTQIPKDISIEFLKTMVTCRFTIQGCDAENALETYLEECIDSFICILNRLLLGILMLEEGYPSIMTPIYDRGTFDFMYLHIQGKNTIRNGRIAINTNKVILNPNSYSAEKSNKFTQYLNGTLEIDIVDKIINTAHSFLEGGMLPYSLLQLVTSAEIETRRFVYEKLVDSGVSKTKLENFDEEFTYGRMLNIDIFSLSPSEKKPDKEIIAILDEGRKKRNKLMHEGQFNATKEDLTKLYDATIKYIEYIKSIKEKKL